MRRDYYRSLIVSIFDSKPERPDTNMESKEKTCEFSIQLRKIYKSPERQ
jgi:hypothetical protein